MIRHTASDYDEKKKVWPGRDELPVPDYKRGLLRAAELAEDLEKECEREMQRFASEGETIGAGSCFQQVLIVRRLSGRLRALAEGK